MALNTMVWFKITLIMMLFYSISITMVTYSMPTDTLDYVTSFSDLAGDIDLDEVSTEVQQSVEKQTNLPIVELGALVFYSGNILIDLLLNFAFAIPEMIALIITGLMMLINMDVQIVASLQLFFSVVIIVVYFISIIQLLTGIRSGRIV